MGEVYIQSEEQREVLVHAVRMHRLPFFAYLKKATATKRRTLEQNRLQRLWLREVAEQTHHSAEELRAYCKLTIGVPILRAENERFRDQYDRVLKHRTYREKMDLMMEPIDLPVTRLMTTVQKSEYLDKIHEFFVSKGFRLTIPPEGAMLSGPR